MFIRRMSFAGLRGGGRIEARPPPKSLAQETPTPSAAEPWPAQAVPRVPAWAAPGPGQLLTWAAPGHAWARLGSWGGAVLFPGYEIGPGCAAGCLGTLNQGDRAGPRELNRTLVIPGPACIIEGRQKRLSALNTNRRKCHDIYNPLQDHPKII